MDLPAASPLLKRTPFWLGGMVFLVAFLLYAKTGSYGYAWDDAIVITENERVQQGFAGLASHWQQHNSGKLGDQYGFRPVVMTSFAIEFGLFGSNPGVSHLLNAFFYGLLCWLTFLALLRLFPNLGWGFHFVVALLFAVHPLHVEAVANIKSRDEIFSMAFSLVSLLLLLRFAASRNLLALIGSLLAFGLAFLSKESAVAFVPVMAFAVLMQDGPLRRKLPALLPLPLLLVLAFAIVQWVVAGRQTAALPDGSGVFVEDKSLGNAMFAAANTSQFIPTGLGLMLRYVKQFLFPWPLVYYSGYDQVALHGWGSFWALGSLAFFGLWAALAAWFWKRDKVPAFALVFFAAYMGIYGHFLRPLADLMADRFMLAPSLGLCLMTCWLIARLTSFRGADLAAGELRAFVQWIWRQGKAFLLIVAVLTLVWSYRTLDRIPVWRDNLALFGTDMPNLERCARCHVFYAGALLDAYQKKGGNPSMAAEIEAHYRKAIMLTPKVYNARIELAQFLYNQQRYAEGIAVAQECQRQFPEAARAYYFLGYGQYFKGDYAEASQNLQKSCSMAPLRQDAPYYLAWSLYFGGQVAEAISQAGAAMLKFPEIDQFPDALSDFQFGSGQVEAGFSTLKAALARLHSPTLYKKIIQRYEESNLPEAAAAYRREAIQHGIQL